MPGAFSQILPILSVQPFLSVPTAHLIFSKKNRFDLHMNKYSKKLWMAALALGLSATAFAQEIDLRNKKDGGYRFQIVKQLEYTPVQNQGRSGTCWSFSGMAFFESELKRMKKGDHNLSEMFVVRNTYRDKADKYVRMHGNLNFGAGGAFHDVVYVWKHYGVVPEEAFTGLQKGETGHNHAELDELTASIVKPVANMKKPSASWKKAYEGVLDAYLGAYPSEFTYKGKTYTPQSFSKELGLNMDDYVAITSFTHHPFYGKFVLEVPDNWMNEQMYNMPLDDMMAALDNALMNGYSVAWAADVSEKGFSFRDGLAIVPTDELKIKKEGEDNRHFNDAGAKKVGAAFEAPVEEKKVTQEMRQEAFDNFETTDDHGMQIVGIAKDQNGTKYYIVKNSWGTANDCGGLFYASEAFVRYKTTNLLLHKDGMPKDLRKKLSL